MVLSTKPLPHDSEEAKQRGKHELQPKTVMNAGHFWDNYCRLCPILKVNKLLYFGRWTFVELHQFEDKLERSWIILDHKIHEGRAWVKAKRIRNQRNLRSAEHWIPAEVFGRNEPAKLPFYIFDNSLFLVDPAWEIGNCFYNWLSVEPVSQKDSKRKMSRRQNQVKKPRRYIDI